MGQPSHIGCMGGGPLHPTNHTPPHLAMTTKQVRDLQAFAVELTKEGRHDAAREVLALIARG